MKCIFQIILTENGENIGDIPMTPMASLVSLSVSSLAVDTEVLLKLQ